MNLLKTMAMVAVIGTLAVTPALAAGVNEGAGGATPSTVNGSPGGNLQNGGSSSNGQGGVQATTPGGGAVTLAGAGQCYLKTKSGKEKLIDCPAGVDATQ